MTLTSVISLRKSSWSLVTLSSFKNLQSSFLGNIRRSSYSNYQSLFKTLGMSYPYQCLRLAITISLCSDNIIHLLPPCQPELGSLVTMILYFHQSINYVPWPISINFKHPFDKRYLIHSQ